MNFYSLIGYVAAVLIVASMIFKTTTYKGTMAMRIINGIGSATFVINGFGIGIDGYPFAFANLAAFIINLVYIIIEYRDHKKEVK